jgi:hypothetical protein
MKQYKKIVSAVLLIITMLIGNSCTDLLKEKPTSTITPAALNTAPGILAAIAGVYNDIRSQYGTEGFTVAQMAGTDEQLEGGGSSSFHRLCTYNGIASGDFTNGFNWYSDINVINGVLENAPTIPVNQLDAATLKVYLGQAQFLRAFLYFYLVQTYGNIPLHITFISSPTYSDTPAAPNDIYKVIIQDLKNAAANLPAKPTAPFLGKAATAGAAKWLLAKAYLTRGWLNTDNNDFTLAYNTADSLIINKGTYGFDLWADYADAFNPINDYGKETIFVSDHSNDPKYGYYSPGTQQSGGNAINVTPWMGLGNMVSNAGVNYVKGSSGTYAAPVVSPNKRSDTGKPDYTVDAKGFITGDADGNPIPGVTAGTVQANILSVNRDVQFGRPYGRIRPNMPYLKSGANTGKSYILDQAFSDRLNDSRFDKTFQRVWLFNADSKGGGSSVFTGTYSGSGPASTRGKPTCGLDTAIWFPDYEVVGAPQMKNNWPFKGSIVTPKLQNSNVYPYMKKLADPSRVHQNDPSTRPVVIARFSEVYLIAAEAALMKGDNTNAAAKLNVIRQRAAFRTGVPYAPGGAFGTVTPATMIGDPYPAGLTLGLAQTNMTIAPGQVTLDFILDERTRELYGESVRWLDLVRTKSLVNRVKAWNAEAAPFIQPYHVLRPIPQDEMQNAAGAYPPNFGY